MTIYSSQVVGLRLQYLIMRAYPQGSSQHGSWFPSECVLKREVRFFCNLISEVISHPFCHLVQPTRKGRGLLHKSDMGIIGVPS